MATVDWNLLMQAMDFYRRGGFTPIEMPWHASLEVTSVTCPNPEAAYPLGDLGYLVGSAEQSFMEAQFNGTLSKGRWVAITPCFRAEPVLDELHLPYFMKVELYSNEDNQEGLDLEFARKARFFMMQYGAAPEVEVVTTDIGFDLEVGGVEVGSYSKRSHGEHTWTCGTGIAEPRFSKALEMFGLADDCC